MNQTVGGGPPPLPPIQPRTPAPVPRTRMHGCLIALIVAACLVIPVVGILAAIAFPAYNDYLSRARLHEAVLEAEPLKQQVVAFHASQGHCPVNGDAGFGNARDYASALRDQVDFWAPADDLCAIEILIGENQGSTIAGVQLLLEYDTGDGKWTCRADIEDRYLPIVCRT
ncbi:MAG: pilin [Luteimonas sp.]|nr:pilin [Luteimonas sp.]